MSILELLATSGIAAAVASAVIAGMLALAKARVDVSLNSRADRQLEELKAGLQTSLEEVKVGLSLEELRAGLQINSQQIGDIFKRRLDALPDLHTAVHESRTLARDLLDNSDTQPVARSGLGDIALFLTERIRGSEWMMPEDLFSLLHDYKNSLQLFVFTYDQLIRTNGSQEKLHESLSRQYRDLDALHQHVERRIRETLGVSQQTDPARQPA